MGYFEDKFADLGKGLDDLVRRFRGMRAPDVHLPSLKDGLGDRAQRAREWIDKKRREVPRASELSARSRLTIIGVCVGAIAIAGGYSGAVLFRSRAAAPLTEKERAALERFGGTPQVSPMFQRAPRAENQPAPPPGGGTQRSAKGSAEPTPPPKE